MRDLRFWLPSISGFFLTPLLIFLLPYTVSAGDSHAGAGMGQLLIAYPVPMMVVVIHPMLAVLAGLVQFPLYGFIISYARLSERVWAMILAAIAGLHLVVIAGFMIYFVIQAFLTSN